MSNGGPLVPTGDVSPIPSRNEVIKDLIKWFASNFGVDMTIDAAERLFAKVDTKALYEKWKAAKGGGGGGGSGGALLVIAGLMLFAGKRKKRRR